MGDDESRDLEPAQKTGSGSRIDAIITTLADLESRRRGALAGPYGPVLRFLRRAGDEFLRLLAERGLTSDLTKYEAIVLGLCNRSLTTFYAVVDMLEMSLSLQALAIHRSLFELMLQTRWLKQDPEPRCGRYIDYDTLHRWYYLKYFHRWGEVQDESLESELTERLYELCHRYGVPEVPTDRAEFARDVGMWADRLRKKSFPGAATGTWHGRNAADLVREVGVDFPSGSRFESGSDYLEYLYRVVFGLASAQLHPSPRVTAEAFSGEPGEQLTVTLGPDPGWTVQVASTSFPFLYWTFEVLDEVCGLDMEKKLEGLMAEHQEVMTKAAADGQNTED